MTDFDVLLGNLPPPSADVMRRLAWSMRSWAHAEPYALELLETWCAGFELSLVEVPDPPENP